MLACCIAAALGLAVDARLVAAFCLGVIATRAQGKAPGASETASYIIAAVYAAVCAACASPSIISRGGALRVLWAALGIMPPLSLRLP